MTPLEELERSLRAACARSPEIASVVSNLGKWLQSIVDSAGTATPFLKPADEAIAGGGAPPVPAPVLAPVPVPAATLAPAPPPLPTKKTTMTIGGQQVEVEVTYDITAPKEFGRPLVVEQPTRPLFTGPDLKVVADRCRLKAEACRWAVRRRALKAANADHMSEVAPTDRAVVERAKALPSCWVWMVDPNFAGRMPDDETLGLLAALYENLASAAETAARVDADDERRPRFIERALLLLAEAQSALRVASEERLFIEREQDQFDSYDWLRDYSQTHRHFIGRFMRLNDGADPAAHARVSGDLAALAKEFDATRSAAKERTKLLNKVKYEVKRLAEAEPGEESLERSRSLDAAVATLLSAGVQPSDAELREVIMPAEERLPDEFDASDPLRRVLAEVQRFVASRDQGREPPPARAPTVEVLQAAKLLEGRRVFLVGGQKNEMARRALERDLLIGELRWMTTNEHQSTAPFEPEVARADVVIVLIRFSGHAFVDDLAEMCDRYDKAYVRVPAGYSTAQVAHHVLKQASRKLVRS